MADSTTVKRRLEQVEIEYVLGLVGATRVLGMKDLKPNSDPNPGSPGEEGARKLQENGWMWPTKPRGFDIDHDLFVQAALLAAPQRALICSRVDTQDGTSLGYYLGRELTLVVKREASDSFVLSWIEDASKDASRVADFLGPIVGGSTAPPITVSAEALAAARVAVSKGNDANARKHLSNEGLSDELIPALTEALGPPASMCELIEIHQGDYILGWRVSLLEKESHAWLEQHAADSVLVHLKRLRADDFDNLVEQALSSTP